MDVVVGLDDWLALEQQRLLASNPNAAQTVAVLVALASSLLSQVDDASPEPVDLTYPDAGAVQALAPDLLQLPTQLAFIRKDEAFAQWLDLAALAEQLELGALPRLMLDALRRAQGRAAGRARNERSVEQLERVGVCWTRRGRIDRTAGHLDNAMECYRLAIQVTKGLPLRDARPLAELGLAALAANRGNVPAAGRRASALLRSRPAVHVLHRFAAHSLLSLVRKKGGRLLDAMLHGWAAYDLVPSDDVRRLEILLTMSELATELGDLDAADEGFAAIMHRTVPARVLVSAVVGATRVFLRRLNMEPGSARQSHGERLREALSNLVTPTAPPRDLTRALLVLSELELAAGLTANAMSLAERANAVALQFGLFEQQFMAAELTQRIAAAGQISASSSRTPSVAEIVFEPLLPHGGAPRAHTGRRTHRPPVLSRLLATAADMNDAERGR